MSVGKGKFYMDLMESVSDALVVIDEGKRVLSINSAASILFGAKRDEVVGMACKELVQSELCGDPCPFEESRSKGDTVANFNIRLAGKNEGTPVCMHTSPVKVDGGDFSGVVENIRVINHIQSLIQDLEGAYEESLEEKKRVEAILNSIAEAVITIDKNWQITSFNLYAEKMTGFSAEEALGMQCRDVIGLDLCGEGCPMEETLKSGRNVSNVETVLMARDGRLIPVSSSTALFRGEGGEVLGGVETYRNLEEIEKIAEKRRARTPYRDIVGKTSRIKGIFDLIEVIKDTDSTVLITGESGVGKELFAKAIHDLSSRRKKPFVKVNCAALTEGLLESELFGHVRGAFTGALSDKLGRFESAAGGTIFLDEIGDVPLLTQVKLLRVLQDHEFERVGSSKTLKVDVRVIAATNRDLKKLMSEDKFREDLFYRLNVIPIHVPPLRERIDDLAEIIDHILSRLSAKGIKSVEGVSPDAMRCLMGYPWPGNVRELENIIERAVVCSRGDVITVSELAEEVLDYCRERQKGIFRGSPYARSEENDASDFDERELILRTLEKNRWNRGETARELKIDRTTLWRKMKKYGLI
jgi:PAS domain S-box-containing protein